MKAVVQFRRPAIARLCLPALVALAVIGCDRGTQPGAATVPAAVV